MKTVAKALLFDKADRILLLRRSLTHPNYPHHYDFPGGEVEQGEVHHEAIRREILEETKLMVFVDAMLPMCEKQISPELTHVIHRVQLLEEQPDVILSWEHDGFIWLTLDELLRHPIPKNPDDYYQTVLEYLRESQTHHVSPRSAPN